MSKEFKTVDMNINTPEKAAMAYRVLEWNWLQSIATQVEQRYKTYNVPREREKLLSDQGELFTAICAASHQARELSRIKQRFGLIVGGTEGRVYASLQWSSQDIDQEETHTGAPVYIAAPQISAVIDGEHKILLHEIAMPALNLDLGMEEEARSTIVFEDIKDPRGTL